MNLKSALRPTLRAALACLIGVVTAFAQQQPQIIWESPSAGFAYYEHVEFSPDGRFLYAAGTNRNGGTDRPLLNKFNAANGVALAGAPNSYFYGISETSVSPDGQRLATANWSVVCSANVPPDCQGGFNLYSASQLNFAAAPAVGNVRNSSVDYSPDGQLLALGGGWFNYAGFGYDNIRIVRASDNALVRNLPGHLRAPNNGGTLSVRFSPNGQLLASGGRDDKVKIWRVADGALLQTFNFTGDPDRTVASVEFSPDGQHLAAINEGLNSEVKIWRVADGALVKTFQATEVYSNWSYVTWSPDGRFLVSANVQDPQEEISRVRFWNFQNGQMAEEYIYPLERPVRSVAFAPNGRTLALATGNRITVARSPFGSLIGGSRTAADFDGDKKTDVSVFRAGNWYAQLSSNNAFRATVFGLATDKIVPADYDADGKTDIAVFRDGAWYVLNSADNSFRAVHWGASGDRPVPGFYDEDEKADFAVFRAGVWYILQSSNGAIRGVQFGLASDQPVAGDYDGDGLFDLGVYRNGMWALLRSKAGMASFMWGQSGDRAVPADYDGDGWTDAAVFDAAGVWRILRSNGGTTVQQFGLPTDRAVPADYDGDGQADIAVFRDGTWYFLRSTGGFAATQFGQAGDQPLPAAFLP